MSFVLFGCNQEKAVSPIFPLAFYHWQTSLHLTPAKKKYLDSIDIKKLYIRFFDIDWDNDRQQIVPIAPIQVLDTAFLQSYQIVPTVFMTERTLSHLTDNQIDTIAQKIYIKINSILKTHFSRHRIAEIQFDCDWTQNSKDIYFQFLRTFKRFSKTSLSATIRLHQFKYQARTGVPPVDKGMLMFYNMGDVENWETQNSILDLSIAQQYFTKKQKYPLPLAVALPIFRWGAVYRDEKLVALLHGLSEHDLIDTIRFKQFSEKNRFLVQKSTYLKSHYLYKNDHIRLESVSLKDLELAKKMLYDHLGQNSFEIAFYHLDIATK